MELDFYKLQDIQIDNLHLWDAPDFVDAFIASATYEGRPLTDSELDEVNNDSKFVYDCVINRLF